MIRDIYSEIENIGVDCLLSCSENSNMYGNNDIVKFRSAAKPFQILPIFIYNLHKKYALTDKELAIFASSHLGQEEHISVLEQLLEKCNISENELICNESAPTGIIANKIWSEKGLPKRKLYNQCAGKHIAFILLQRELGGNEYFKSDSLVQKEVKSIIEFFCKRKVQTCQDSCGVPTFYVSMCEIANMYNKLAFPQNIDNFEIRRAAELYVPILNKEAFMVGGDGYFTTILNSNENIISKTGANCLLAFGLKKENVSWVIKAKNKSWARIAYLAEKILYNYGYKIDLRQYV